jgi:hypothetical protein
LPYLNLSFVRGQTRAGGACSDRARVS